MENKPVLVEWINRLPKRLDPNGKWAVAKFMGPDKKQYFCIAHRISQKQFCEKHMQFSEKGDLEKHIGSLKNSSQSFCLICVPKKTKPEYTTTLEELRNMAGLKYETPKGFFFSSFSSEEEERNLLNQIILWKTKLDEIEENISMGSIETVLSEDDKTYTKSKAREDLQKILEKYETFFRERGYPPPEAFTGSEKLEILREKAGVEFTANTSTTGNVTEEIRLLEEIIKIRKGISSRDKRLRDIRFEYKKLEDLVDILNKIASIINQIKMEKMKEEEGYMRLLEKRIELREKAKVKGPENKPSKKNLEVEISLLEELEESKTLLEISTIDEYEKPSDLSTLVIYYGILQKKKERDELRNQAYASAPFYEPENESEIEEEIENLQKLLVLKESIGNEEIDEYEGLESLKELVEQYKDVTQNNPRLLVGIARLKYLEENLKTLKRQNDASEKELVDKISERERLEEELMNTKMQIENLGNEILNRASEIDEVEQEIEELENENLEEYQSSSSLSLVDERNQLLYDLGMDGGEVDLTNLDDEIKSLVEIKRLLIDAGLDMGDMSLRGVKRRYSNINELKNIEKSVRRFAIPK